MMNTDTPQTMLQEIKAATRWSEPMIAKEIGTSQATVNRLLNGQPDCKSRTWRAIHDLRERLRSEGKEIPDRRSHDTGSVSDPH